MGVESLSSNSWPLRSVWRKEQSVTKWNIYSNSGQTHTFYLLAGFTDRAASKRNREVGGICSRGVISGLSPDYRTSFAVSLKYAFPLCLCHGRSIFVENSYVLLNYYHSLKSKFLGVPCILIEIKILQKEGKYEVTVFSVLTWPWFQAREESRSGVLSRFGISSERGKGFLLSVYGFLGHVYLGSPAREHIFLLFNPLLSN